jgi:hypothetical protein
MQALMVMLASKMPKLRVFVAEHLYMSTALLLAQSSAQPPASWTSGCLASLQGVLRTQRWGTEDVAEVRATRLQVIQLLGLQPPKARVEPAGSEARPAKRSQADETYQGLLNDFARGL